MRKFLLLILTLAAIAGCTSDNEFVIKGNITPEVLPNITGHVVYIAPYAQKMVPVDSIVITSQKTFRLKGKTETPQIYAFYLKGGNQPQTFIGEPGRIKCTFDEKGIKVYGNKLNDEYNAMNLEFRKISAPMVKKYVDPINSKNLDKKKVDQEYFDSILKTGTDYYRRNIDNPVGILALANVLNVVQNLTKEQIISLVQEGGEYVSDNFMIRQILEEKERAELQMEMKAAESAEKESK